MKMKIRSFGIVSNGQTAKIATLMNRNGMTTEVTNYGATLVSVMVPDKNGEIADVVLGYEEVKDYIANGGYLGAVIGRNGNRIYKGEVTINGTVFQMEQNEKGNSLHSGNSGFDKALWKMELLQEENGVRFSYQSPHMDQGLPGNLDVCVTYILTEENEVKIHYKAVSDADTIVNMTNHSYFNLAGHNKGNIEDHILWVDADAFTVIDKNLIPTGEIRKVEGTPLDFRKGKRIGEDIENPDQQMVLAGGYDHNFVLKLSNDHTVRKIAGVLEPSSGRRMEVFTDCVGVQFYSGNFIESTQIGKGGIPYEKRSGFCLETQSFPDAPNHEQFPTTVLKAGEVYDTTTIYQFL